MLDMNRIHREYDKRAIIGGAVFDLIVKAYNEVDPEKYLAKYSEQALKREETVYDELRLMYDDDSFSDEEVKMKEREYRQAQEITYAANDLIDAIVKLVKAADDFVEVTLIPTEKWEA